MSDDTITLTERLIESGPDEQVPCLVCRKPTKSHILIVRYEDGEAEHVDELVENRRGDEDDVEVSTEWAGEEIGWGWLCHTCWTDHDLSERAPVTGDDAAALVETFDDETLWTGVVE